MKTSFLFAIVLAAAGCASTSQSTRSSSDSVSGHYLGTIDRDGWQRPLAVDLTDSGAGYSGSWMSLETQPGVMLDGVSVKGTAVHFALKALSFDGQVSGRTLSGTVVDTATQKPSGQFTLTRVDPMERVAP